MATEVWERDGIPDKPGAWLTTVAKNKALDRIRREARRADKEAEAVRLLTDDPAPAGDDRLRLLFTCCHPALAIESQVALALADAVRPDDGGDRARVPHPRADGRTADQPRQGQDRAGAHPVPDPRGARAARRGCRACWRASISSSPPVMTHLWAS